MTTVSWKHIVTNSSTVGCLKTNKSVDTSAAVKSSGMFNFECSEWPRAQKNKRQRAMKKDADWSAFLYRLPHDFIYLFIYFSPLLGRNERKSYTDAGPNSGYFFSGTFSVLIGLSGMLPFLCTCCCEQFMNTLLHIQLEKKKWVYVTTLNLPLVVCLCSSICRGWCDSPESSLRVLVVLALRNTSNSLRWLTVRTDTRTPCTGAMVKRRMW